MVLVALEEMSYAEISRALGIPMGTVMSRLSRGRGRERLRRVLDPGPVKHALSGELDRATLTRVATSVYKQLEP